MNNRTIIFKARDHLAALLAVLACGHVIGLVDLAGALPRGVMAVDGFSGQIIGAAVCGLVYAFVLTMLYRRRLVAGPVSLRRDSPDHRSPQVLRAGIGPLAGRLAVSLIASTPTCQQR